MKIKIIVVFILSCLFGLVHADTFTYSSNGGGGWSADGNGSHTTTTVYK